MLRGYDPLKENSQWRAIVSLLAGELILVGIALSPTYNSLYFTTLKWHGVPFWILPLLYIIFAIAFPPLNYFSYKRENLRREALRQEVLKGTDHLLASRQPLVSSEYSLPLTAKRQLKPLTLIGSVIYVLLALAFCALAVIMAFSSSWRVPAFLAIGVYGVSGLTAFLPLYVNPPMQNLITHHYLHPLLQIDEDSITAYYGQQAIVMRWQDVRYFALTSSAALRKELLTANSFKRVAYEICDGENIICWIGATLNAGYNWEERPELDLLSGLEYLSARYR